MADNNAGESLFYADTAVPVRLLHELDRLLTARVATIIAPAGYNKTGLVRAWLRSHPELDDTVLVAIIRRDKDIQNVDALLEPLAAIPPGPHPIVIWVDNHDRIKSPAALNQIFDLADANPRIRVILAGRTRPNAALGALALRGQLVSIGLDDLTLTGDEVGELVGRRRQVSAEGIALLMEMFGGWPIAVELAASPSVNWKQQPMLEATISGYIQEEILADIDPADIAFLQDLSVMPELTPAAAAHVSGRADAVAHLTRLAAAGVPLEWDAENVIRFHPTLARHLRRTLREENPERKLAQNRKAAAWLHGHGHSREAIAHAVQSNDIELVFDLAADLLVAQIGEGLTGLASWFDELAEILPPSFHLGLARTLVLVLSQPEAVGTSALRGLKLQIPDPPGPNDLGRFHGVVLSVARATNYTKAPDLVADAVAFAQAVHDGRETLRPLDAACLLLEHGLYLVANGRLELAREVLQQVTANAQIVAMGWLVDFSQGALALTNALLGAASTAQRMAQECVIAVEGGHRPRWMTEFALLALAHVALDRGQTATARAHLDELAAVSGGRLVTGIEPLRLALDCLVRLDEGDPRAAMAELETYRAGFAASCTDYQLFQLSSVHFQAALTLGDSTLAMRELAVQDGLDLTETAVATRLTNHARLDLARGQAAVAHETLGRVIEQQEIGFNNKQSLHVLMTHGIAASQLGLGEEALGTFQRAGVLADRLGLGTAGARHTRTANAIRLDQVPLTPAERQVLTELARDVPLSEVATALYISPNTLKTHLRRIYKKMGVANRAEAVERARVAGLV